MCLGLRWGVAGAAGAERRPGRCVCGHSCCTWLSASLFFFLPPQVTKVKTDRPSPENPYHSRPRPEPNPEIEGNFWCYCLVTKSCPTLCNPMDCSMAGFPVLHYLLEFAQIPVHWFSDSIQPSPPLLPLSPFPLIFPSNGVFSNELALLIKWTKYWSFSISPSNDYSGLISFRI